MNYLAHFHLAGDDEGMIIGALLGDFIKGPLSSSAISALNLSTGIRQGIHLHRCIDSHVDQLPELSQLGRMLPPSLWRYKHIFLDLFFDYMLCLNWQSFDHRALNDYCNKIITILNQHRVSMPNSAKQFLLRLDEYQLLCRYGQRSVQTAIIKRLGQRLNQVDLFDQAVDVIWQLEAPWMSSCQRIYPEIQDFATAKRLELGRSF